jgi:hypothetical protein
MSYRLKIADNAFSPSEPWFNKSWLAMDDARKIYKSSPHQLYEKIYNVKLHQGGTLKSAEYIEFPSEADAIMFLLRWS